MVNVVRLARGTRRQRLPTPGLSPPQGHPLARRGLRGRAHLTACGLRFRGAGHLTLACDDHERFGFKPAAAIVPHSSRERPGDVKKRRERLEHRIRRSGTRFDHRRRYRNRPREHKRAIVPQSGPASGGGLPGIEGEDGPPPWPGSRLSKAEAVRSSSRHSARGTGEARGGVLEAAEQGSRTMRAWALFAGLAAISTVVIAGPASAKVGSITEANITGPGLVPR